MSDREMSPRDDVPEGWSDMGAAFRAAPEGASSFEQVDGGAVRKRADAFARTIRYRNVREVAAGALVVVAGVTIAARAVSPLGLAGGVAMALGAIFVSAFIVVRARGLRAPEVAAPTSEVLAYERAELDRQARLLERVWIWYLAPLLPSIVLLYAEGIQRSLAQEGGARSAGLAIHLTLFAVSLGLFVFLGRLNRRAARGLRERMAKLPPPIAPGE